MKTTLRLVLPRLRELNTHSALHFALLDRELKILRRGELPLDELAVALAPRFIQAILHPDDTVHVSVPVPPLAGARMEAAIAAIVEPLTLSAADQLAIAHGPRQADGHATLVWADRDPLARAWHAFVQAGLDQVCFYPYALVVPSAGEQEALAGHPAQGLHPDIAGHAAVSEAADVENHATVSGAADVAGRARVSDAACFPDAFWQHPAPAWSLNPQALRPAASRASHWRAPLLWAGAAAAVWLVGLNIYAARIAQESQTLRLGMQHQVAQAFPDMAVVLDPLKQATQRRDALRAAQGTVTDGDAIPLALAAAQLLPDTRNRVQKLHYDKGVLTLDLEEDDSAAAPDARPVEQASAQGLALARTDGGWRIERIRADAGNGAAPEAGSPGRLRIRQGGQ